MIRSQNLFREYILFRSRMAVYAAMLLAILLVVGLAALLAASPVNVNRFGLLLQILGVLALAPDIIGKDTLSSWRKARAGAVPQTGGPLPTEPDAPLPEEAFYNFYQANNLTFVLGNVLASAALVWLLADAVLNPRADLFPLERVWRALFSLLGFAWLNFFMLLHIFRLSGKEVSRAILAWFFAIDLLVGILGVIFAGLIHILLRWGSGGLRFLFANGPRRVLLVITLPFFVVGLFFELIATFL